MYAIIRKDDGSNYKSLVFGRYSDQKDFSDYFIVLDEEKTKLVKKYMFSKSSKYLDQRVLITDCSTDDWNIDDKCEGQWNRFNSFLPDLLRDNKIEPELLKECIKLDSEYVFHDFVDVKTESDIKNLDWLAGNFHDAYISKIEKDKDKLYVLFKGIWGCSIEFCFSDFVSYHVHEGDTMDSYWFGASMYFKNGLFCLINDEDSEIDETLSCFTWFMSKKTSYHIILN